MSGSDDEQAVDLPFAAPAGAGVRLAVPRTAWIISVLVELIRSTPLLVQDGLGHAPQAGQD